MNRYLASLAFLAAMAASGTAAAGGPLGIDHRVHYDNSGIWKRGNQNALMYGTIATVGIGALAFGSEDKLGNTFWRSVDAMVISSAGAEVLKHTFQRERPSQTDNPDRFFRGWHAQSFPSGEVTAITAAVTPFIVAYGNDHPAVYALALLPAYDAVARVKTRGHWQSDVLAGAAIGAGVGLWAAHRQSPLIVSWLPGGFQVGFVHHFKP
ncbi:phosphoesterase PA-phosphatase [Rhodanobacter sp. FW510-R12]|uniref:phosphatase PAP2 family protein n=1 Tax=unclassified Rhodanobacter TaxID=2621553 RepID=UPI0007A99764|nr:MULTISPECIES: phosphatase PAP2 family protein [unclassified Rhodanobacter]KZC18389.1 phosphoesterase PA-phosphatase [Rhodanobacter sp. FW104-R8]KZC26797.1 phosphoesterase PA-phosphatase [Rhodanobacter sp. FW510-T8]KZC30431.1 phosphoesterase PA-phosphatase [Rhodanobacter sp. FW510-R10]